MEKNYKQLAVDLNKIVGIQADFDDSLGDNILTVIEKSLKERITHLLRNDYSALLNILYRVDVAERKVYECMDHDTLDGIASCLTTAIIERQLMKIVLRK